MEENNSDFFELKENKKPFNYLLYGFGGTFAIMILYLSGGVVTELFLKGLVPQLSYGALNAVGQLIFMLAPTLLFLRFMPDKTANTLMLNFDKKPSVYFIAILGFIPVLIFYSSYSYIQDIYISAYFQPHYDNYKKQIEILYEKLVLQGGKNTFMEALVIVAIIPAVCEEVLFRGLLFGNLIKKWKPTLVIVLTAFIFALFHFNPVGFIPLFLIGSYLGFTAYYTRSIIIPVIIHFINNFISVTAMYSPELEKIDKDPSVIPLEYMIISMAASTVLLFLVGSYLVKNKPAN